MRKVFFLLIVGLLFVTTVSAQTLVNFSRNAVMKAVVIPENTAKAIETMRRRGVGTNLLRQYVVNDSSLNHVSGMPAVMAQARKFFDEGFYD